MIAIHILLELAFSGLAAQSGLYLLLQLADELAVEAEELARERRVVLRAAPRVRERRFAALPFRKFMNRCFILLLLFFFSLFLCSFLCLDPAGSVHKFAQLVV